MEEVVEVLYFEEQMEQQGLLQVLEEFGYLFSHWEMSPWLGWKCPDPPLQIRTDVTEEPSGG